MSRLNPVSQDEEDWTRALLGAEAEKRRAISPWQYNCAEIRTGVYYSTYLLSKSADESETQFLKLNAC